MVEGKNPTNSCTALPRGSAEKKDFGPELLMMIKAQQPLLTYVSDLVRFVFDGF
jgi:hypothetical protein